MKLTVLGAGSPLASAERVSSGYLLEVGGEKIMLEVGPGTVQRLVEAGHRPTEIAKVVISHLHFDHWLDLMRLVLCRWDEGGAGQAPLQVWGPEGIRDIVETAFGQTGLLKLDLTARTNHKDSVALYHKRGGTGKRPWPEVQVFDLDENTAIGGDGWEMTFREVPHQQPYLISYGMRVKAGDRVFTYSSDISCEPENGPPPGLVELAQGAEVLVQYMNKFKAGAARGGNHIDFHQMIARMAQDAGVGVLITTHLGPKICEPEFSDRVQREMAEIFSGEIIWGRDLLEIDIGT